MAINYDKTYKTGDAVERKNFLTIRVEIDDTLNWIPRDTVEVPENYDMGAVQDYVEGFITDVIAHAVQERGKTYFDELVADFVREDIEENYKTKEYRVCVETREVVSKTYYVYVEAENEEDAEKQATDQVENGDVDADDEEQYGFDSIEATEIELQA